MSTFMTLEFTPRQREVLDLLVLGFSNAEIGQSMRPPIAKETVKRHLIAAAWRFGYRGCNRVELAVRWTREQGA